VISGKFAVRANEPVTEKRNLSPESRDTRESISVIQRVYVQLRLCSQNGHR
jgi:hypothetical protein